MDEEEDEEEEEPEVVVSGESAGVTMTSGGRGAFGQCGV